LVFQTACFIKIRYNALFYKQTISQGTPMLLPEQVKTLIEGVTPCEHVEVEGDGHHFFAVIVSSSFEGKARLARHRLIKDGLKPQLESNELHALSISVAATPAEWAAKQA
jgi:bolA/yrbA family protein